MIAPVPTRCSRYGNGAFTLVELLLVMIILGVVAGIAVPRYASFLAQQRLAASTRRIITDLALAQRRARISSTAQTVTFEVGEDSYTLEDMQDPDHSDRLYHVNLRDEPYNATIGSADFGGDAEIVFDGYGVPDSDGTLVIQLGTHQKTLTLDAQTGRVSVSEVVEEPEEPPIPPEEPPLEED